MRIAHLINTLTCAGAEQVVASLAIYHSQCGHSVKIICLRSIGENPVDIDLLITANVEIISLDKPPGLHISTLKKLRNILINHSIEVLHTHNHLVHHYGAVAGRLAKIPAILNTLHGTSSLQMSPSWTKLLFWISCQLSHRIVCVDQQVDTVFRQNYPLLSKRLTVIENGIDLRSFLVVQHAPKQNALTLGTIGRLDSIKGHDILLRAFADLHKDHPDLQLRILGDGALRQPLIDLAKNLLISDHVHFDGFSRNTPAFLVHLDLYVISSLSEGLPLSLLEAMAASLPIVATAVGGIPGIINQAACGWLCPPRDPEALAKTLHQAITDPHLHEMGARSRQAAVDRFSIEKMANRYEILYRQLST